jgi:hypothetical protein
LVVSLLYLLFRRALGVAALRLRSREFKELEIVVLRRELALLRRQISRSRLDGNGVELYRDRPREDWPDQMTRTPLDVRALLAEAPS